MDSSSLLRSPTSLTRSSYPFPRRSTPALRMPPYPITTFKETSTGLFGLSRPNPLSGFKTRPKSAVESDDDENDDAHGLFYLVKSPAKLSDSDDESEDDEEEAALKGFGFTAADAQMMMKSIYQQLKHGVPTKRFKSDGFDAKMLCKPGMFKEDGEALYLKIDMPGLGKEDIKVRFANNVLCINGENGEEEKKYSEHVSVCNEIFKVREMKAEMKNGVLKVVIPKIKVEEREDYVMVNVD